MNIIKNMRVALISTILILVIVCGIYPAMVWGIGQLLFPHQANGSLIVRDNRIAGSSLLAQNFMGNRYFHPRPSAAGIGYAGASSGGSNLGPLSRKLVDTLRTRVNDYRAENGLRPGIPVPADAVTASASGLDPHISVKNALLQAPRVARARNLNEEQILVKIRKHTEGRELGIFGEPRVNVLLLNLDLDKGK